VVYAECRYDEYRYAECCYAGCFLSWMWFINKPFILSVVMQNVVAPCILIKYEMIETQHIIKCEI
jgi:hypothetical protein